MFVRMEFRKIANRQDNNAISDKIDYNYYLTGLDNIKGDINVMPKNMIVRNLDYER